MYSIANLLPFATDNPMDEPLKDDDIEKALAVVIDTAMKATTDFISL